MSNTQQHKEESLIPAIFGYETRNYFLLDLDKRTSLEEVKRLALDLSEKYGLGDFIIVESSKDSQLALDLKPLQNYNIIFGKRVPFQYQQWILKQLRNSGIDIKYIEFREKEQSSTLRVSPKSEVKGCGKVVAYVKVNGENEGIKEYLKMLWVGKQIEKYLKELER